MKVGVDFKSVSMRPGIGAFLSRLLSEVARHESRHQFVLFGPRSALSQATRGGECETRTVEIYAGLGRFRLPYYDQVQLPWALWKADIDAFFCPYYDAPLLTSKPLIITVHDLVTLRFSKQYPLHSTLYFNSLLRRHARRASRILTVSEFSRRDIVQLLGIPEEKVCVLPYVVPPGFLRNITSAEINGVLQRLGVQSEYILYTGGVDWRKNLRRLFYAIGRINREGPRRYPLVLTGHTSQYLRLKPEWEREGLGRDVVLAGFLPEDELAALYRGTTLTVYPSLWEGCGLPLLEAIACGSPIAASHASSIPEVAGEAAVYFNPWDVDEMVRVIRDVLQDPLLRTHLSAAARDRRAVFQSNRAAEVLMKVFDEIACAC